MVTSSQMWALNRPLVIAVCAVTLHISELILQGATLVAVILLVKHSHEFPMAILCFFWLKIFILHFAKAWKEFELGSSCVLWVVRALFFGLTRWAHMRHIWMVYEKQCATLAVDSAGTSEVDSARSAEQLSTRLLDVELGSQHGELQQQQHSLAAAGAAAPMAALARHSYLHGKTSYSVLAAFPFAIFSLYSLSVLDMCGDKKYQGNIQVGSNILLYRGVFACTSYVSMLSIAACTLDVDYFASGWVFKQVTDSFTYAWLHLIRRFLEVASSMVLLILASVQALEWLDEPIIGPLCLFIPVTMFWMFNTIILRFAKPAGEPEESWLSHICIGLVALVVVPSMFVDLPGYRSAAKRANLRLWIMKCLFFVALLVAAIVPHVGLPWIQPLDSHSCLIERNTCLLIVFVVLLIMYLLVSAVSRTCFGKPMKQHDRSVLRVMPNSNPTTASQSQRVSAPLNFSSFLLKVAVGLSGNIFGEDEDFVIERRLGAGAYGVVVQVRRAQRSNSQTPTKFALKLQNREYGGPHKEATILRNINHPFLVHLLYFFDVPGDQPFLYENDGSKVGGCGPTTTFRTGIMMELCNEGTLETLLHEKWHEDEATSCEQLKLDQAEWTRLLHLWRKLGAELANVFAFLHGLSPPVVYRDLKPDNVLLRTGHLHLHVCLTDFGLAKRPTDENPLKSDVGNPFMKAPEIAKGGKYTPQVDNWSLGQLLLCMLWCTWREHEGVKYPKKPHRELWCLEEGKDPDPRVPPLAVTLIDKLMQQDPEERGTMQEAAQAEFFTATFRHMDENFDPVPMPDLLKDAKR